MDLSDHLRHGSLRLRPAGADPYARVVKARALVVSLAVVAAACTSSSTSSTSAPVPAPAEPIQLRVATLNIEYGGEVIDFDATVEAALALDADVIGIEEAWGNIPDLAAAMGYQHFDVRHHLVSRFPLLDPPRRSDAYLYVEVTPGHVVAVGNVHLPSSPYGPNLARAGKEAVEIFNTEQLVRIPAVEPFAKPLSDAATRGVPAFLVGDMNSPSHLDWTPDAVGTRPHVRFAMEWPVTTTIEALGFLDSFREVHPDPVTDPGLTWPAARPKAEDSWNPGPNAAADRIDYVFHAGPSQTVDAQIAGERGVADIVVTPWPTDHRGLVSTFTVTPAPMPALVSPVTRRVTLGTPAQIRVHAAGVATGSVVVSSTDGTVTATTALDGTIDTTLPFDTTGWSGGAYEASLVDGAGEVIATAAFWAAPGDVASIVAPGSLAEGEPLDVSWVGAPGNRWDWIGIYRRGADPNVDWYLTWAYTDATVGGSVTMDENAEGRWPLPGGDYTVHLLEDDGYTSLAKADFTITPS